MTYWWVVTCFPINPSVLQSVSGVSGAIYIFIVLYCNFSLSADDFNKNNN